MAVKERRRVKHSCQRCPWQEGGEQITIFKIASKQEELAILFKIASKREVESLLLLSKEEGKEES